MNDYNIFDEVNNSLNNERNSSMFTLNKREKPTLIEENFIPETNFDKTKSFVEKIDRNSVKSIPSPENRSSNTNLNSRFNVGKFRKNNNIEHDTYEPIIRKKNIKINDSDDEDNIPNNANSEPSRIPLKKIFPYNNDSKPIVSNKRSFNRNNSSIEEVKGMIDNLEDKLSYNVYDENSSIERIKDVVKKLEMQMMSNNRPLKEIVKNNEVVNSNEISNFFKQISENMNNDREILIDKFDQLIDNINDRMKDKTPNLERQLSNLNELIDNVRNINSKITDRISNMEMTFDELKRDITNNVKEQTENITKNINNKLQEKLNDTMKNISSDLSMKIKTEVEKELRDVIINIRLELKETVKEAKDLLKEEVSNIKNSFNENDMGDKIKWMLADVIGRY